MPDTTPPDQESPHLPGTHSLVGGDRQWPAIVTWKLEQRFRDAVLGTQRQRALFARYFLKQKFTSYIPPIKELKKIYQRVRAANYGPAQDVLLLQASLDQTPLEACLSLCAHPSPHLLWLSEVRSSETDIRNPILGLGLLHIRPCRLGWKIQRQI